jgi:hypothetical protein
LRAAKSGLTWNGALGYVGEMADPLALSPLARANTGRFGDEAQPLLVIDDFLAEPEAVLAIAARAPFRPIGPHYPGIRSPVPAAALEAMIAAWAERLIADFALPSPPRYFECFLSLVTLAPGELKPIQRLPHFDGLDPNALALLLYLDRAETGGTAFYRQRATGFESIDEARLDTFTRSLERDIARLGLPGPDYVRGDTAIYKRIGEVAGRFNRAVVYRGNTLHCADLPPGFVPVPDPRQGRLTLNLFLRCTG